MKCDTARGNIFYVAGKQTVAGGGVWAGATSARNGDLMVAFGTTSDGVWGGKVMLTRSTDGGATWSAPGVLVESQWKETGATGAGSGMATLSDGTILLPFVDVTTPRIPGAPITGPIQTYMDLKGEGNSGRAYVMRSSDNGETWTTPYWIVRTGTLTRPHGRILELQEGSVICPVIVYKILRLEDVPLATPGSSVPSIWAGCGATWRWWRTGIPGTRKSWGRGNDSMKRGLSSSQAAGSSP